jgi:Uma2 family endonuclease
MFAMTTAAPPARFVPPRRFDNGAEWIAAFGGVPLARIIFDPWPGTATEADLLQFVERDKRLCELVENTLVEKPVGYLESFVAGILIMHLNQFVLPRRLGSVTGEAGMMRMAGGRVRMPDVAFVSIDRLPGRQIPREPIPNLAPDLAVEVLSESNTKAEIDQKLREYFQSGTRLAWIIDPPTRSVAVYRAAGEPARVLKESEALDGEGVLPGFTLAVAALFENVPR